MSRKGDVDQMKLGQYIFCNIYFRKSGRIFNKFTLFDIYFEIV